MKVSFGIVCIADGSSLVIKMFDYISKTYFKLYKYGMMIKGNMGGCGIWK